MRVYQRRNRPGMASQAAPQSIAADTEQHSGVAAWTRRHAAARRVAPLNCGCPDRWPCRCTDPPLSDQALDAWRDAAVYLRARGLTPLLPLEVLRGLYRRGGPDRALAEELHAAAGQVVA